MATEYTAPLDIWRPVLDFPLSMLVLEQDWRQELNTLESGRIGRDHEALLRTQRAISEAHDWSALVASYQSILHAYQEATVAIWQLGISLGAANQGRFSAGLRDAFRQCQSGATDIWGNSPPPTALSAPGAEWIAAYERAVARQSCSHTGSMTGGPKKDVAVAAAATGSPAERGARHVG